MSHQTFRELATAIVVAHQKGDTALSGVIGFLLSRGIQVTPDQETQLKRVLESDIEPILSQSRGSTAPKREADEDPEGLPGAKRQKQDTDNDDAAAAAAAEDTGLRLDNLPVEIIDAIATQLGNVFELAKFRTISVGTAQGASRAYTRTVETLRRPFCVDNYVDYTNQDNLADLLLHKTTKKPWEVDNLNWTLRWMSALKDSVIQDTSDDEFFIWKLDKAIGPFIAARYVNVAPGEPVQRPPFSNSILYGMPATQANSIDYLTDLVQYYETRTHPGIQTGRETLKLFKALDGIMQTGAPSEIAPALESIVALLPLIIVFYELRAYAEARWIRGGTRGIVASLKDLMPEKGFTVKQKKLLPLQGDVYRDDPGWIDAMMPIFLPGWDERFENEDFIKSSTHMAFEYASPFAYILYSIAKNVDKYETCLKGLPASALTWFAHCAATSQQQVDRCMQDSSIQFILNDKSVNNYVRCVVLACRSYVLCTGVHLNRRRLETQTRLEKILRKVFDKLGASLDKSPNKEDATAVYKYEARRKYVQIIEQINS